MRRIVPVLLGAALTLAACGSDGDSDSEAASSEAQESTSSESGLTLVTPEEAAATIADPPDDLVILDVRTSEEFEEARIDGATMLDFYREDFRDELAQLDRDVPYVLYCRSGNRSGQTLEIMRELGFTNVQDVSGGIVSWVDEGLLTVSG